MPHCNEYQLEEENNSRKDIIECEYCDLNSETEEVFNDHMNNIHNEWNLTQYQYVDINISISSIFST